MTSCQEYKEEGRWGCQNSQIPFRTASARDPRGLGVRGEHEGPTSYNLTAAGGAASGRSSLLLPGLGTRGQASQELQSPLGHGTWLDQRKVRERGVLKCFKVRQTGGWTDLGTGERPTVVQACETHHGVCTFLLKVKNKWAACWTLSIIYFVIYWELPGVRCTIL